MYQLPINACTVGSWVWRLPNTRGKIVSEVRNSMYGDPLKHVQWDEGEAETLYSNNLTSTGSIDSLEKFAEAVQSGADPELTLGCQGGFREFSMQIRHEGHDHKLHLHKSDRPFFAAIVLPALVMAKAKVKVTTLANARSKTGRDSKKTLTAKKVSEWFED